MAETVKGHRRVVKIAPPSMQEIRDADASTKGANSVAQAAINIANTLQQEARALVVTVLRAKGEALPERVYWTISYERGEITWSDAPIEAEAE